MSLISKIINFILSPWWFKESYSKYYINKKSGTGFTLYEMVSFFWQIPLVILSFGFKNSESESENWTKGLFLGFLHVYIILLIIE